MSEPSGRRDEIREWIHTLTWGGPDSRVDALCCLYWTGAPALPDLRSALEASLHLGGCPRPIERPTHSRVAAITRLLLALRSIDVTACASAARSALRDDHPLVRRAVLNILEVAELGSPPKMDAPIPAYAPPGDQSQLPIPHPGTEIS